LVGSITVGPPIVGVCAGGKGGDTGSGFNDGLDCNEIACRRLRTRVRHINNPAITSTASVPMPRLTAVLKPLGLEANSTGSLLVVVGVDGVDDPELDCVVVVAGEAVGGGAVAAVVGVAGVAVGGVGLGVLVLGVGLTGGSDAGGGVGAGVAGGGAGAETVIAPEPFGHPELGQVPE
jgi:hypothetical protein